MEIVSLTGTNIIGGAQQFGMQVRANGEDYNIPISFDTYQLLNELAALSKEQVPVMADPTPFQQQPVFELPVEEPTPEPDVNPLDQLAKVGLFEPQNVLDSVSLSPEDDLMGVLEDTSDEDDEDDPGEMSIDDGVDQYTGS